MRLLVVELDVSLLQEELDVSLLQEELDVSSLGQRKPQLLSLAWLSSRSLVECLRELATS